MLLDLPLCLFLVPRYVLLLALDTVTEPFLPCIPVSFFKLDTAIAWFSWPTESWLSTDWARYWTDPSWFLSSVDNWNAIDPWWSCIEMAFLSWIMRSFGHFVYKLFKIETWSETHLKSPISDWLCTLVLLLSWGNGSLRMLLLSCKLEPLCAQSWFCIKLSFCML